MENEKNCVILTDDKIEKLLEILDSDLVGISKADYFFHECYLMDVEYTISVTDKKDYDKLEKLKRLKMACIDFDNLYDNPYKTCLKTINDNLIKLNKVYEIYTRNCSEIQKMIEMTKICEGLKEFKRAFYRLAKSGKKDRRLDEAREALNHYDDLLKFYKKININDKEVKYFSNCLPFLENYEYAKFIIEEYIIGENNSNIYEFLQRYGIDDKILEYCENVIEELNLELYKSYLQKKKENQLKFISDNVKIFNELANNIKTGKNTDDTDFNVLTFFDKLPFKYSVDYFNLTKNFMKKHCLNTYQIVFDYLAKYGICTKNYNKLMVIKEEYLDTKYVIEGNEISLDDKQAAMDYLVNRNIPINNATFDMTIKLQVKKMLPGVDENYNKILIPKTKKLR